MHKQTATHHIKHAIFTNLCNIERDDSIMADDITKTLDDAAGAAKTLIQKPRGVLPTGLRAAAHAAGWGIISYLSGGAVPAAFAFAMAASPIAKSALGQIIKDPEKAIDTVVQGEKDLHAKTSGKIISAQRVRLAGMAQ